MSDVTFLGNIVSELVISGFSWTSFAFRFLSFRSLSRKLQKVSEWLDSWRKQNIDSVVEISLKIIWQKADDVKYIAFDLFPISYFHIADSTN